MIFRRLSQRPPHLRSRVDLRRQAWWTGWLLLALWLCLAPNHGWAQAANLVRNSGFETEGSPAREWSQDTGKTGNKGSITRDASRAHGGQFSLKLAPNNSNGGEHPLAVAQEIPAGEFRGKTVEFSAWMAAEGDARASVGMLSLVRGKPGNLVMLQQVQGRNGWQLEVRGYDVPDDPSTKLYLALWVDGKSGAAWFDDVAVSLPGSAQQPTASGGNNPGTSTTPGSTTTSTPGGTSGAAPAPTTVADLKATVEVDAGTVLRRIPRSVYGANVEWRWNATYMWREERQAADPTGLKLTRDMGVSLIRYPGGIYSDFYNWKDGIGPVNKRPIVKHEPGKEDKTRPVFGTDEALGFARDVGGELMITVNAGTGTAQQAAEWVRYVNANELKVRYWEVGNELYINDGSPVSKATSIGPEKYAQRFLEFAKAMRAADPRIKIGAIGGENQGRYSSVSYPNWNRILFEKASSEIDFLSVHNAYAPLISDDEEKRKDLRAIYRSMLAAPTLIARNMRTIEQQLADWGSPTRKPFIAVSEWGPIFQWVHKGRYVDHPKTLGSALFAASTLKTLVESPKVEIAAFWMLNDFSVLGWLSSTDGSFPPPNPKWAMTARAYAFQMFTRHFGEQLLRSTTTSPSFDSEAIGVTDAVRGAPWLDVVSSLSADGRTLYLLAINKHFDANIEAAISVKGFRPAAQGSAVTLNGTGIDAHAGSTVLQVPGLVWGKQMEDEGHRRFGRGAPSEITLVNTPFRGAGERFSYTFPAHSVTSLILTRQ